MSQIRKIPFQIGTLSKRTLIFISAPSFALRGSIVDDLTDYPSFFLHASAVNSGLFLDPIIRVDPR